MHPALSLWIWYNALLRGSPLELAVREVRSAAGNGNLDPAYRHLPLAMKLRLDHMRQPSHNCLQLARFYSERYRSF